METLKYGLYSKLVGKSRNKKIKESNNYEKLYDKGISLFNKDKERLRDYFIVEYGVKATTINNTVVL